MHQNLPKARGKNIEQRPSATRTSCEDAPVLEVISHRALNMHLKSIEGWRGPECGRRCRDVPVRAVTVGLSFTACLCSPLSATESGLSDLPHHSCPRTDLIPSSSLLWRPPCESSSAPAAVYTVAEPPAGPPVPTGLSLPQLSRYLEKTMFPLTFFLLSAHCKSITG